MKTKTNELKKQVNGILAKKESAEELIIAAGYDWTRYIGRGYCWRPSAGLVDKICKVITDAGCKTIKMYMYKKRLETARAQREQQKKERIEKRQRDREFSEKHPFLDRENAINKMFCKTYRISVNGSVEVHYAKKDGENAVKLRVNAYENWDKANACKSYKYSTTEYLYTLNVPIRYNYAVIGGLLTFFRGRFDRNGAKCSWIEQGKGVSDFCIKSGYVVKGEHIECKTLQDARRINAEHRAALLAKLLKQRKHIKETQKKMNTTYCTIQDSISAGNCMPGTMNFCNKLFAVLGREVNKITLSELRKYGKMFKVEQYAERVIRYML